LEPMLRCRSGERLMRFQFWLSSERIIGTSNEFGQISTVIEIIFNLSKTFAGIQPFFHAGTQAVA
jgi:hypothetical protein